MQGNSTIDGGFDFTLLGKAINNGIQKPEHLVPELIYRSGIHTIYSEPATGKTVLALWAAYQTVLDGEHIIYVDEENGSNRAGELLESMGADNGLLDAYFHYLEFPSLTIKGEMLDTWKREVGSIKPALVVFDSLADMLALNGLDENNSVHITNWVKGVCDPVKQEGGSVLLLDHLNKEDSGRGARGSTAKLAKVDVAWKLKVNDQFDRDTLGKVTLERQKDRSGGMPRNVVYRIGGDGLDNLDVRPEYSTRGALESELSDNSLHVLNVLRNFPNGATDTEWKDAAMSVENGVSRSSYYDCKKELIPDFVYQDGKKFHVVQEVQPESSELE